MKNVIFHPLAEQELIDATAYHEEQKPGLGLEFLEQLEDAVNFLMRYPEAGSKVRSSVRRVILPKFSYLSALSYFRRRSDSHFSGCTSQA